MLEGAGLRLGATVKCRNFSHYEEAVRAVLLGEVDACGVRDIVAQKYVVGRVLRVLARSEEIPNFPFVASPACPPNVRDELLSILVSVPGRDATEAGTIKGWDEELTEGFSPASDEDYAPIRRLALSVFGPAGLTLPGTALQCRSGGP
jgi:ABC-type phosphate/phosphonate transport system substrate-binding protein